MTSRRQGRCSCKGGIEHLNLSKQDRIVHLLNRFGLGATETEVEHFTGIGVDGTIHDLIEYETIPDTFSVSPARFFFRPNNTVDMDTSRVALWWILRMATSPRPSQEKLALFWHSHFAVSGSKVEFGPMMLQYVNTLRDNANGAFGDLLVRVSKTPAMLQWLDTDKSLPGHPNENFAREVMELFTLGIGNYSENDIKESARAYTGWSVRYPFYELQGMTTEDRARYTFGVAGPAVAFQDAPDLHDNGPKTFLGETAPMTAEDVLGKLASHEKTAENICRKMWEFYAYPNPDPKIVTRLAKRFIKSNGDIKQVLYAIAGSREFWSDQSVGNMVKSPVDFAIGALRQVGGSEPLAALAAQPATYDDPMDGYLEGQLYFLARNMASQGLSVLYPPNVSGWKWDTAWATEGAFVDRSHFQDFAFAYGHNGIFPARDLVQNIMTDHKDGTEAAIVDRLLGAMQVKMSPDKVAVLVDACKRAGGAKSLTDLRKATAMAHQVVRFIYASPEYQLC